MLTLRRWRGGKAFTMRCTKCGTPFCRRCHLGQVAGGLCTQCHHLFVVRDGVSGPARNRKLLEVQKEEARRDRVFRVLSLLVPGAGPPLRAPDRDRDRARLHLVGHAGRGAADRAAAAADRGLRASFPSPGASGVAGLVLLITYVMANRSKPEFDEVMLPIRRAAAAAPARRRAS